LLQLFLLKSTVGAASFQVVTAKSSEVNITVMGAGEEEEPKEHPVPEQFISVFQDGKLVTNVANHSSA
jgi:adenylyl cyclase-associated protein